MSRGRIVSGANQVEWVSEGKIEYLLTPSTSLAQEALALLELEWPDPSIPVTPAELYLKLLNHAKNLYVPDQRGSKGSINQDRLYQYARLKPSDKPGEPWESQDLVPAPQQVNGQIIISAIGNHMDGWRVMTRQDERWKILNIRWTNNEYVADKDSNPKTFPNYFSAYVHMCGAGFADRSDDDYDPISTIEYLDHLLTAELYRMRTGRVRTDFDDRTVNRLIRRRQMAIDAKKRLMAEDSDS